MDKQKEILRYLLTVESATLDDIYKNVSFSYYCNYSKHLGAIMSRMVENGSVIRVKKGVFSLGVKRQLAQEKTDETQLNIF